MNFKINIELAQAIANYLQNKPYKEVKHLIEGLTNLQLIKEEVKDAK
jgi:hypothetical protein